MKCVGGASIVLASGWVSSKIFDVAAQHGSLSAVGFFFVFILVSVFGLAFSKNS